MSLITEPVELKGDRALNILLHEWVTVQLAKIPAPHDMRVVVGVSREVEKVGDTYIANVTVQAEPMT